MKHRLLPLLIPVLLLACGDEDKLDPACQDYCSALCPQIAACGIAEQGQCASDCRSAMETARVPAMTCTSARPFADMDCGPLEGWTQQWFTRGWHEFPDYEGHLAVTENTCWPGQDAALEADFTLEVEFYRGEVYFELHSILVGQPHQVFLDSCVLNADGNCNWVFPYEYWPLGDASCIIDKTDRISLLPSLDAIAGTVSIEEVHRSGICTNHVASLPCEVHWAIDGTPVAE